MRFDTENDFLNGSPTPVLASIKGAGGCVVTHSPLTPTARFNSRWHSRAWHRLSIFRGSVKCIAISKQWVTAVEDCEHTLTFLRMTLRIGHWGFQPAIVTIVTFFTLLFTLACAGLPPGFNIFITPRQSSSWLALISSTIRPTIFVRGDNQAKIIFISFE